MAIKYLNNLDLNKNQLQQAVIQTASSDPSSPVAGQVYYNTTENVLKFYNGTAFVSTGGDLTAVTSATTGQLTIANSTGPIPALTIVTGTVANAGTALATGDQIYDFVTTGINARIQNVTNPTGAQDAATKAYVDTVATGLLEYKGAYNASTNSPALTGGSNIASDKGDTYTVTADGSFLGEQVRVGDLIIVEVAISASSTPALTSFTIVQSNVDLATAAATSGATVKGISGYDSNNFSVTGGFVSLKKFSASIGDGSNTSYTVNHALGSRDVIVQLYDNSSYDTVIADVVRTDTNNVTISFTVAPSTNDIRVLIQKI